MALDINGERIEDELIREEFEHIKKTYQKSYQESLKASAASKENSADTSPNSPPQSPASPPLAPIPDDEALLSLVKENITRKTLLRQEALKENITIPEEELNAALHDFMEQTHPPSHTEAHIPFETLSDKEKAQLRTHVETNLKITALLEKVSTDINPIEPHHIKAFYETNLDHYRKNARVHLHYLAHSPKSSIPLDLPLNQEVLHSLTLKFSALKTALSTLTKSQDKLNAFKHSIDHPAPPAIQSLFKTHCPEMLLLSGDLELREITTLAPEIISAVETLLPTEISSPVIMGNTVYLFYLLTRHAPGIPSLAEITDEVEADLLREIKERKQDMYVAKLMNTHKIIDYEYL